VTTDSPTLTEQLAAFWSRTRYDDLPNHVVAGIKDHILDTLAVALVGTTTPEVRRVTDALSRFSAGVDGGRPGVGNRYTPHPGAGSAGQRNFSACPRFR
jgi:2-methylcitrate dehydratase PrpD